jgi:hypothetical protein
VKSLVVGEWKKIFKKRKPVVSNFGDRNRKMVKFDVWDCTAWRGRLENGGVEQVGRAAYDVHNLTCCIPLEYAVFFAALKRRAESCCGRACAVMEC